MLQNIADIRKDYTLNGLDLKDVLTDPVQQFRKWFDECLKANVAEPNAMTLSTIDLNNRPAGRIVLLKGVEEGGFTFFTNYNSNKGAHLAAHPFAALTFFWIELERQVRITGRIEKVSKEESDAYFAVRPRGSQIGAWVSEQSTELVSRESLNDRLTLFEEKFKDTEVPRPEHWGGYKLIPDSVEFWQGRASRLHDRIVYNLAENGNWTISRLAP